MNHIYILDYNAGGIYHAVVSDEDLYNPNLDLMKMFGLNSDECSYLVSDKELYIEEIEPAYGKFIRDIEQDY